MAGKAKFDQEAAFKSIIGTGRESEGLVVAAKRPTTVERRSPADDMRSQT